MISDDLTGPPERYDDQGRLLAILWPVWQEIKVKDAVEIELPWNGIEAPMNEIGERCPWPWDPQQLVGVPMGQYHCPYCGGMQVAGIPHVEWDEESVAEYNAPYGEVESDAETPGQDAETDL